jgi:hypothetical protein
MPKFYFNIVDHDSLNDTEGTELAGVEAARQHAYAVAREVARHRDGMLGHPWREWTMTVKDANGEEVFSFPLSDALEDSGRGRLRVSDKSAPQSRD